MVIRVAICCDEDKYLGQVEQALTEYAKNKGVLFSINSFSSTFALFETMVSDFQIFIFDTKLTSPKRIKLAQSIKKKINSPI